MKITFKEGKAQTRDVPKRGDREAFTARFQVGMLTAGPNQMELEVRLNREQQPYAAGVYEVDERTFTVDAYKRLSVGNLELRAVGVGGAPVAQARAQG